MLDNAPIRRLRVGRHLARPGRKTHHRRVARGARRAIQTQLNRRRARRRRILTPVPSAYFRTDLGLQFRLNPAKRLAQIHRHIDVRLTQHAVAAKTDHVGYFRQVRLGTRRPGTRHQGAGRVLALGFLAVVRRIRQLKRQVAKITGRHRGRCDGGIRRHRLTRTLGIDPRITRAIDARDPGAISAQRGEVLRQPEHRVLAGQRQHPIHLDPIGRVGRPLVDNPFCAQHIRATQHIETIAHHRISRRAPGQAGAIQIGEVKTVQIARGNAVLLVGDGGQAEKIRDMHRVIAKFNTGGVVADKVRHLQHVVRIGVGINATAFNRGITGAWDPGLKSLVVSQNTPLARNGRSDKSARSVKNGRNGSPTIGEEVRAHRGTIARRCGLGIVFGGERNRLLLILSPAHGDDFHIPGLGPHAVDGRQGQAVALRGRRRAGGVGRGPGHGAVRIVAEKARVDILRRHHYIEVQGVQAIGGAAQADFNHLRVVAGIDDMNPRYPLVAHRVVRHQGQIAALGGDRHGPGAGHRGQARAGCEQRGGQGQGAEF